MPQRLRSNFAEGIYVAVVGTEIRDTIFHRDWTTDGAAGLVLPDEFARVHIKRADYATLAAHVKPIARERWSAGKLIVVIIAPLHQPGKSVESVHVAVGRTC